MKTIKIQNIYQDRTLDFPLQTLVSMAKRGNLDALRKIIEHENEDLFLGSEDYNIKEMTQEEVVNLLKTIREAHDNGEINDFEYGLFTNVVAKYYIPPEEVLQKTEQGIDAAIEEINKTFIETGLINKDIANLSEEDAQEYIQKVVNKYCEAVGINPPPEVSINDTEEGNAAEYRPGENTLSVKLKYFQEVYKDKDNLRSNSYIDLLSSAIHEAHHALQNPAVSNCELDEYLQIMEQIKVSHNLAKRYLVESHKKGEDLTEEISLFKRYKDYQSTFEEIGPRIAEEIFSDKLIDKIVENEFGVASTKDLRNAINEYKEILDGMHQPWLDGKNYGRIAERFQSNNLNDGKLELQANLDLDVLPDIDEAIQIPEKNVSKGSQIFDEIVSDFQRYIENEVGDFQVGDAESVALNISNLPINKKDDFQLS
jgi:hypothetical protein